MRFGADEATRRLREAFDDELYRRLAEVKATYAFRHNKPFEPSTSAPHLTPGSRRG